MRTAAIVAVLSLAGPASAADRGIHFAEMKRLCVDTGADPAAALGAAAASGWKVAPAAMVRAIKPNFSVEATRYKWDGPRLLLFYAAVKAQSSGSNKICTMIAKPGDGRLLGDAAAWAAIPPEKVTKDSADYVFYSIHGQHVPPAAVGGQIASDDEAHARFRALGVATQINESFATYFVPAKSLN